ncbi:MAG: hypothetical protein WCR97_02945 [Bacilli bacterium]
MAKIIRKIASKVRFSKKDRPTYRRGFMNFVESFTDYVDPKNFNI